MITPSSQIIMGNLNRINSSSNMHNQLNFRRWKSLIKTFTPILRISIKSSQLLFSTSSQNTWHTMFHQLSSQPFETSQKKSASLRDRIIASHSENEDCILRLSDTTDPALKRWISDQRYYYKKQNKVAGKYLTMEQIKLFNKINFIWDVRECMWNIRLNELKEYQRKYGHCIVPRTYKYFPELPSWVHNIRNRKRNEEKERPSPSIATLTKRQTLDLNELNFVWEVQDSNWYEKFYELKHFYKNHGHTQVTKSNHDDKSLTFWVNHQRSRCKNKEKINLLDSIEFIWNVPQGRSSASSDKTSTENSIT